MGAVGARTPSAASWRPSEAGSSMGGGRVGTMSGVLVGPPDSVNSGRRRSSMHDGRALPAAVRAQWGGQYEGGGGGGSRTRPSAVAACSSL